MRPVGLDLQGCAHPVDHQPSIEPRCSQLFQCQRDKGRHISNPFIVHRLTNRCKGFSSRIARLISADNASWPIVALDQAAPLIPPVEANQKALACG